MQQANKTVIKSMDILNLFRMYPSLNLNEITELSNIPKTSAYRMVSALLEMGFLEKNAEGKYMLGLIFLEFGQLVRDRLDLRHAAYPIMQSLRDEVKEAVNLVVKDHHEAIYIEKLDTDQPVRLFTKVGRRSPLYAGACSRILLAFLPQEEQESYFKQTSLKPITSKTITDKEKLRSLLAEVQRDGYTISHSELEEGTTAIAAPIFDSSDRIIAGLSVAGPDIRFQEDRLAFLTEKVVESASLISEKLGHK